jgi:hypothetical protein
MRYCINSTTYSPPTTDFVLFLSLNTYVSGTTWILCMHLSKPSKIFGLPESRSEMSPIRIVTTMCTLKSELLKITCGS